jgi:serine/threonine protein kinase
LAPEILQRKPHNHTVDIYGLGVLTYNMLVGFPPFYHTHRPTLFQKILRDRLRCPSFVSPSAASLVEKTMCREPSERLGAKNTPDVQDHSFFENMDWGALMQRDLPPPYWGEEAAARNPSLQPWEPKFVNPFTPSKLYGCADTGSQEPRPSVQVTGWEFATATPRPSQVPACGPEHHG